jgi:threonine dehydratase
VPSADHHLVDIDLARIEEAARVIDPVFLDSPQFTSEQLCAALGREVLVKLEVANPPGSFKGRGADFLVRFLSPGSTVVGASSGNMDASGGQHPRRPDRAVSGRDRLP